MVYLDRWTDGRIRLRDVSRLRGGAQIELRRKEGKERKKRKKKERKEEKEEREEERKKEKFEKRKKDERVSLA